MAFPPRGSDGGARIHFLPGLCENSRRRCEGEELCGALSKKEQTCDREHQHRPEGIIATHTLRSACSTQPTIADVGIIPDVRATSRPLRIMTMLGMPRMP